LDIMKFRVIFVFLVLTAVLSSCSIFYETNEYQGFHKNGNIKYHEKETKTIHYLITERSKYYQNGQMRVKYRDGNYIEKWRLYDSTGVLIQKVFRVDRTSVLNFFHPRILYEGRGNFTIEKTYTNHGKLFFSVKRKSWPSIFDFGISKLKYIENDTITGKLKYKIHYNPKNGFMKKYDTNGFESIIIESLDTLKIIDSVLYNRLIKTHNP